MAETWYSIVEDNLKYRIHLVFYQREPLKRQYVFTQWSEVFYLSLSLWICITVSLPSLYFYLPVYDHDPCYIVHFEILNYIVISQYWFTIFHLICFPFLWCALSSVILTFEYVLNWIIFPLKNFLLTSTFFCCDVIMTEVPVKPKLSIQKMILAFCVILAQTLRGYFFSVRPLISP